MEPINEPTIITLKNPERDYVLPGNYEIKKPPEPSEWKCYLFGNAPTNDWGLTWRPAKGQHPNWFWRKMQYLCFGNVWIKS